MKLMTKTNEEIELTRYPITDDINPEILIPGFCIGCNRSHDLPARDWFLVKGADNVMQMVCGHSLPLIV